MALKMAVEPSHSCLNEAFGADMPGFSSFVVGQSGRLDRGALPLRFCPSLYRRPRLCTLLPRSFGYVQFAGTRRSCQQFLRGLQRCILAVEHDDCCTFGLRPSRLGPSFVVAEAEDGPAPSQVEIRIFRRTPAHRSDLE